MQPKSWLGRAAHLVLAACLLSVSFGTSAIADTRPLRCGGQRVDIVGTKANDHIKGTPSSDVIAGLRGGDRITGLGGDDVVCGGRGRDQLIGGAGSDVLRGGKGVDRIHGGAAADRLFSQGASSGCEYEPFYEVLIGGDGDDEIVGSDDSSDRIFGGPGDDDADGKGTPSSDLCGRDEIHGGDGNDSLRAEDAVLAGGSGDDVMTNDGGVFVDYHSSQSGVSVDLATGVATGEGSDRLEGIANVYGSDFDDLLIGNDSDNYLIGLGGDDHTEGHEGDDRIDGMAGTDDLDGGEGRDTVSYTSTSGPILVDLGAGTVTGSDTDSVRSVEIVFGTRLDDTMSGTEADEVFDGWAGGDDITAGGGNDAIGMSLAGWGESEGASELDGGSGDDLIRTIGTGQDVLRGDAGSDQLFSGRGDDILESGPGDDYMQDDGLSDDSFTGGDGDDTFIVGGGRDELDGGLGSDMLRAGAPEAAEVDLAAGTWKSESIDHSFVSMENVIGTIYPDRLMGNDGPNTLYGDFWAEDPGGPSFGSSDHIEGGGGDDALFGQSRDDTLDGGSGNDFIDGGPGEDSCISGEQTVNCEHVEQRLSA